MWCGGLRARAQHQNTHTYTNQYHLHSFFPDGCLPVLTVLRVSHQERRSVSVTGSCAMGTVSRVVKTVLSVGGSSLCRLVR